MKIKTTEADNPILEWVDKMAKYFRRSRSQQIMWLLKRLATIQQEEGFLTVAKSEIFNGSKTPSTVSLPGQAPGSTPKVA